MGGAGIEGPCRTEHLISSRTAFSGCGEYDLLEVAQAMRSLSDRVADAGQPSDELVTVAVERVPGARWASVTMMRGDRFTTAASTAEQAARADTLQYELGSGPCVDAVLEDSVFVTGDVSAEDRWGEWGRRANTEVGINSVFSQRLHHHDSSRVVAGLNLYSDAPDAFDHAAVGVGLILATHGALVHGEDSSLGFGLPHTGRDPPADRIQQNVPTVRCRRGQGLITVVHEDAAPPALTRRNHSRSARETGPWIPPHSWVVAGGGETHGWHRLSLQPGGSALSPRCGWRTRLGVPGWCVCSDQPTAGAGCRW